MTPAYSVAAYCKIAPNSIRKPILILSILCGSLLLGTTAIGANDNVASQLRYGMSQSYSSPFLIRDEQNNIRGGIIDDLFTLIAKKMKLQPVRVLLSRNRMENALQSGDIDVICNTTPEWQQHPENFSWSESLIPMRELVVGLNNTPPVDNLDMLKGKVLGTVTGYYYPDLKTYFAKHEIKNEEAPAEDNLIKKLVVGRSDYAIINEYAYGYFRKKTGARRLLSAKTFVLATHATRCALSPKTFISQQQFFDTIKLLKKDKTLDAILTRYR